MSNQLIRNGVVHTYDTEEELAELHAKFKEQDRIAMQIYGVKLPVAETAQEESDESEDSDNDEDLTEESDDNNVLDDGIANGQDESEVGSDEIDEDAEIQKLIDEEDKEED